MAPVFVLLAHSLKETCRCSSIVTPSPSPGSSTGWQSWQALCKGVQGARLQVNMSVAVIPMAEELGWSALDRGLVNSAFFWGYSLTQIPAGWVSTKCGTLLRHPVVCDACVECSVSV